jgi:GNAT superfamily N-acetyltransferase
MIAHRLLSDDDFESLYDCFLTAFSDYEVDMRMSREQFQQRLMRDGVRLEMSAGAFDGERMVGFCINATGEWQGKSTAYDAGTGVIPEYRGRGVAKDLFAYLEGQLKEAGVVQYLLEVLTSNVQRPRCIENSDSKTRDVSRYFDRIPGSISRSLLLFDVSNNLIGTCIDRSGMVIHRGRTRSTQLKELQAVDLSSRLTSRMNALVMALCSFPRRT